MLRSDSFLVEIRPASSDEWDQAWEECPYATYFHSRQWAEVWSHYHRGYLRPAPLLVRLDDERDIVFPLSRRVSRLGRTLQWVSSPAGTYGGYLSNHELNLAQARRLTTALLERFRPLSWRLNPYDPITSQLDLVGLREDFTRTLDLTVGKEAILRSWTKGHRSAAKKAERLGVHVRLAKTLEDWQAYYKIYERTLERWGDRASSRYQWRLFQRLFECGSEHVKLWLAEVEGLAVAGALCLASGKHIVYWHGAADEEFFPLRPVHLLIREIVFWSCETGMQWFDLNPSGGHAGVDLFKKGFGTVSMRSDVHVCSPSPARGQTPFRDFIKSVARYRQSPR